MEHHLVPQSIKQHDMIRSTTMQINVHIPLNSKILRNIVSLIVIVFFPKQTYASLVYHMHAVDYAYV